MQDILQIVATYGFAGLFSILFWRFIKEEQQEQTKKMQTMTHQLTRIEDILQVEELRYHRERDRELEGERDDDE